MNKNNFYTDDFLCKLYVAKEYNKKIIDICFDNIEPNVFQLGWNYHVIILGL